jgi:HEAT repeat protein
VTSLDMASTARQPSVTCRGANGQRSIGREAGRWQQEGRVFVVSLLWLAVFGLAGIVFAMDDLSAVFATLRENTGLSGNIVVSLQTQDRLAELVKQDPGSVVPAIVAELKGLSTADGKAVNYRMALISALEKAGPAAEAAVPALTEIVQDEKERNDFVLLKAQMALAAIGTPQARDAGRAAGRKSVEHWARGASAADLTRAVEEHAYLIRRELRSTHLSEEIIDASVTALAVMGKDASSAAPELLQAWRDPRIGTSLRARVTTALGAVGVEDAEAAAGERDERHAEALPLEGILADVRSNESLVSTLAMMELAERGASPQAVDALIAALEEKRNPGQAALVLGRFGQPARRAIPFLLPYARDRSAGPNVIQALGLLGEGDARVTQVLRAIVSDGGSPHRALAAAALGSLHSPSALFELRGALSGTDKYTRILSAKAIGALGSQGAPAIGELAALLEDHDLDIRAAAVDSLGSIGPPAAPAVPKIEQQLELPDRRLKEAAVSALERIGGEQASAALMRDARRYAEADRLEYRQLRQSGGPEALVRFTRDLSKARRIQIGREMVKDPDAAIAQAGAALLIEEGEPPPTAEVSPTR